MNLTELWKSFNIKTALANIVHAWNEVAPNSMRSVWEIIIPHCANDFQGFGTEMIQQITDLVV